ncbi:hypothetical protein CWRG_01383 [Chthonomonas calidirosea]|uniref:Cell division protein SepF n=1 Tax=Chthonomonas calidirosea (strain DSM 23976 / ICMP 18418 / T49) TaxID=1303518 RepID=S0EZQ1_CHTCT|nr:cell division protein SepF [Chthonomonas calidirosea]CCW36481.1 Uncharacterized protein conserved in bacteria [Chthonomonas calidirosea T49]CEK16119.1 hypothetical protein CWRG_01383 [Chthonomonas calidirosea]CEK16121.1 hypothetical protein CP488_01400 [Chthonomonas calidirosea]CEK17211.1 hypothetical protein CTKA_01400 [Chthonomonas calidirosea]
MNSPSFEEQEHRSLLHRIKDMFLGPDDQEDEAEEHPSEAEVARRPQQPLRLHTARTSRVAVRRNAQVFEDARVTADGLKMGEQQIVNLEKASPQMGERIIDFLSGVCYALDGTVERIGDRVYLFVPANVEVEVDEGTASSGNTTRSTTP